MKERYINREILVVAFVEERGVGEFVMCIAPLVAVLLCFLFVLIAVDRGRGMEYMSVAGHEACAKSSISSWFLTFSLRPIFLHAVCIFKRTRCMNMTERKKAPILQRIGHNGREAWEEERHGESAEQDRRETTRRGRSPEPVERKLAR